MSETGGNNDVTLRPVDRDNVRAVCELKLGPGQEHYVAPAAYTVAEGAFDPEASVHAIYAGETLVGVAALSREAEWKLVRLMIDVDQQRRGMGSRAIEALAEHARVEGATELLTSYRAGPDEPLGFYLKAGFEATGREEEGEQVLRLRL